MISNFQPFLQKSSSRLVILSILLFGTQALRAEVKLPALFSNHAVLEKSAKVPVWGKAEPGERVTVTLGLNKAEAIAGTDGKWQTSLDLSKSESGPFELQVEGKNKITLTDILVGQVWICSGQSNMAAALAGVTGGQEAAQTANPQLRLFTVKQAISTTPLEDCAGAWTLSSRATSSNFSAVGYFFGSKLQKDLQVPIGMINTSSPGTFVEAWTSAEALDSDPDLKETREQMMEEIRTYPQRLEAYLTGFPAWEKKHDRADRGTGALPDEAGWKPVTLPGEVSGSGAVWLRRTVTIPPELSGKPLSLVLRGIPGLDTVYWKGAKLAETGLAKHLDGTGRNYAVPGSEPGDFPLVIRIFSSTAKIVLRSPFELNKTTPIPAPVVIPLTGAWQFKSEFELPEADAAMLAEIPPLPGKNPMEAGKASVLFNAMVHPLAPYAIAGAIWYQGESNAARAFQYRKALPLLITGWRAKWGQGDFPFYFCQLPNFRPKTAEFKDADWAELREAQNMTLSLPKTGQAVLIDVGEEANLHPVNKKDPGERLALIALAQVYGKNVVFSGPVYDSYKTEDDKIRLHFKNTDGGLVAKALQPTYAPKVGGPEKPLELYSPNSPLQGFAICGEDRKWEWADAKIEGDNVVVSSSKVARPVAVRYAWAQNPTCNLYNGAGLPASPFRTDDFPISTLKTKYRAAKY